jgi:hypothetical protein
MQKLTSAAILAIIPFALSAAQITLHDGTVIYGRFVSGDNRTIIFDDESGARRRFSVNQVEFIDLQAPSTSSYDRGYGAYNSGSPVCCEENSTAWRSYSGPPAQSDWITIPAGTAVSVRADVGINSCNSAPGFTYPASIVNDVRDPAGNVLIPRLAPAQLVMQSDNRGGYFLGLNSVVVGGRQYRVETEDVASAQCGCADRQMPTYTGGGAASGRLVGAMAGGGAQLLPRGRDVRVPPETILNFRLQQPLNLRGLW